MKKGQKQGKTYRIDCGKDSKITNDSFPHRVQTWAEGPPMFIRMEKEIEALKRQLAASASCAPPTHRMIEAEATKAMLTDAAKRDMTKRDVIEDLIYALAESICSLESLADQISGCGSPVTVAGPSGPQSQQPARPPTTFSSFLSEELPGVIDSFRQRVNEATSNIRRGLF